MSEEILEEEVKNANSPVLESDADEEKPLDKNVRLMSPTQMVVRRFFRSKLSIVGLIMLAALFIFSWFGPVVYRQWGETETDRTASTEYTDVKVVVNEGTADEYYFYQVLETDKQINKFTKPSANHILGTDANGLDVFTRLMYGGRLSLSVAFIAVIMVSVLGIVFGGIAGFFGGRIDNLIMRVCDILMCLPGLPLMLIIGTLLDSWGVSSQFRIYYLMAILSLFSWPGMARLVRGQILSLREQEYMVAAEAMGYSTGRKIFKHLIPNVLPQILVSMTLSLGSMILYEASLSFLGFGVKQPNASWGIMINAAEDMEILTSYFNIWAPSGICIIIAVLGFNFIGDGLRDALDPKMRR